MKSAEFYITSGLLELYVAGVLEPEQSREVEQAAREYPRVKEELESIESTLVTYAGSFAPSEPPSIDSLLEKISNTPQQEIPVEVPVVKPVQKQAKPERKPEPVDRTITREPIQQKVIYRTGGYGWLAAATIVLLFLSVGYNIFQYSQVKDIENSEAEARVRASDYQDKYQSTSSDYEKVMKELAIYRDPQFKVVMVKGLDKAPESEAMVYWNRSKKSVYLKLMHLPSPPEGKEYQLWAIDENGNPQDAGVIPPDHMASPELAPMKNVDSASGFAITLEPMGGSTSPNMDEMYAMGKI